MSIPLIVLVLTTLGNSWYARSHRISAAFAVVGWVVIGGSLLSRHLV